MRVRGYLSCVASSRDVKAPTPLIPRVLRDMATRQGVLIDVGFRTGVRAEARWKVKTGGIVVRGKEDVWRR